MSQFSTPVIVQSLEENRIAWIITVERGSLLERCVIDSLYFLHSTHGDQYTYATYDKYCAADLLEYQTANAKELAKERLTPYKY